MGPVEPDALDAFARRLAVQRDGADVVIGSAHGPELHGGGVLALALGHWRPDGRPATLRDRFPFGARGERVALAELWASHERQIFLPAAPGLARMRLRWRDAGRSEQTVETDAYAFLRLLALHERDLARAWSNAAGQRLSAERLLHGAWERYLAAPDPAAERADHAWLHLPELLLDYERRRAPALDPNRVKERFLAVELARTGFDGDDEREALAHYAESLGHLLEHPRVTWSAPERAAVLRWLRALETQRFRTLAGPEPAELCHLLAGLRRIDAQRGKLAQESGAPR